MTRESWIIENVTIMHGPRSNTLQFDMIRMARHFYSKLGKSE